MVIYNQPWTGYVDGYVYRTLGASHASNLGAKAVLIRSITDFSIYSPHTGSQVNMFVLYMQHSYRLSSKYICFIYTILTQVIRLLYLFCI